MSNNKINSYEVLRPLSEDFKQNIQTVYIYGNSVTNVLLTTKDDTVYEYNCSKNTLTRIVELNGVKVKKFDSGFDFSAHILALTKTGEVYGWGNNYWGQLGNGTCNNSYRPSINQFLEQFFITDICCGVIHSLVLTVDGEIFTFGGNNWGQIGSNCYDNQLTPFKVNESLSVKIVAISCGFYHSLALTENGQLFIWGYNEYESNKDTQNTPTRVQMPYSNVIINKIVSGSYHSLLLSLDGDIYAFGSNECGQLGIKSKRNEKCSPIKIITAYKFVDIASSKYSYLSVGLTSSGMCCVWGKCGEELIKFPKQTDLTAIAEAFSKYSKPQITYTTISISSEINLIEKNDKFNLEFTTVKSLGKGGFGEVIQAKSAIDSKMYAIKQIAIKIDDRENVSKELTFLSQFKSHFIVEYFDSWLESNGHNNGDLPVVLNIQMELCSLTLKDVNQLLKQSLTASEMLTLVGYYMACDLFTEIFECVNYLHIQCPSVIHRDLKPDNILITEGINGRFVKLADFGLSTFHEFSEQSHTCGTGTKQFVAPEVYYTKFYDTKADIYSLGAIMLETFNIDFNACHNDGNTKEENIFYLNFLKKLMPQNGKNSSKTGRKYKMLCKLIKKMLSPNKKTRPSCTEILSNKHFWYIDINDIKDDKELAKYRNVNLNAMSFIENFHCFFINRKLKYYNII